MDKCGGGGGGGERGEDPYEEQLLAVFESCDREGRGLLDGEGLSQLCQMLHLEERRDELVSKLIGPTKLPTLVNDITFPKFREALLAILATPSDTRESSPVREVSPKFVYGQKKYGRRSRPESTDHDFQDLTIEEAEAETFIVEIQDSHRNGKVKKDI
ncbi:hypothetical protein AAG570_006456 [Ranatra chinensis]|uniref:EF-hand domain-containing protein n=1 Tax=Ranatra chinensis TaxID=642074 RepID=A0ABD0YU47_9HEMI